MASTDKKISLPMLTAMVVGGMIGAGIFSLPRTFAIATGPFGAVIAWIIAGTGMYMLARVFQSLAERKPDMDAGVYAIKHGASGATTELWEKRSNRFARVRRAGLAYQSTRSASQ